MDNLSEWLRQVPDQLRIDFGSLDNNTNRESVSIFLHFHSCVNMTARPLVFYVIQRRLEAEAQGSATEDWKEGLSQNIVAVIDSSITAARATTMIMDAAMKQNLIGRSACGLVPVCSRLTSHPATYGYFDGEYVFSAALLLMMVNAAFPHDETNARAMDMAMNILRGMADRGNTYLGARHSLLLELQSALGPKSTKTGLEESSHSNNTTTPTVEVPVTLTSTHPQQHDCTPAGPAEENPPVMSSADWSAPQDLPSIQDISFNFDINDDPGLWEEVLDNIDIDMDTGWIESTLRR